MFLWDFKGVYMGLPVVFYKGYFLKNFGKKDLRNLENE